MTTARTSKIRLVVGLLSTADELAHALADLAAWYLRPAQIRIVAQAEALDGALGRWPAEGDARGFGAWVVCRPAREPVSWVLTATGPGPDRTAAQDAYALLGLHQWALRRQGQRLDRHLRAGGALLLVEPHSDTEEWEACTMLLRHASGGVQTHEIARLETSGST